jgi:hypothetical protein
MTVVCATTRAEEILKLLVTHEALSFPALRALMPNPVSDSRLRKLLDGLVREGSVRKRLFKLSTGHFAFFEPGEHPGQNSGPGSIHSSRLIHNDLCAFAAETLRRQYPTSVCVREHEIPRHEKLREVMRYLPGSRDSLPDLLLLVPTDHPSGPVFVAVEIERSAKSSKRIQQKLYKYAARTRLDGVIYLSEEPRVLATMRLRYSKDIASRARRVSHYRTHFLITAHCPTKHLLDFANARNSMDAPVSLADWMRLLSTKSMSDRRDLVF